LAGAGLLLAAALLATDCVPPNPVVGNQVYRLMECEECNAGELDSVLALGQLAVPELAIRLRDGPPATRVTRYRSFLVERLTALRRLRSAGPQAGTPDSAAYVQAFLDNYKASYQVRSAGALGRIGGPDARVALQNALASHLRDDVVQMVRFTLDSVWTP
jgi:hypothetical protein